MRGKEKGRERERRAERKRERVYVETGVWGREGKRERERGGDIKLVAKFKPRSAMQQNKEVFLHSIVTTPYDISYM